MLIHFFPCDYSLWISRRNNTKKIAKCEQVGSKQAPGREAKSQMASGNAGGGTGEQEVSPNWELDRFQPKVMCTFHNFCYKLVFL